jgi:hypothetical protein
MHGGQGIGQVAARTVYCLTAHWHDPLTRRVFCMPLTAAHAKVCQEPATPAQTALANRNTN